MHDTHKTISRRLVEGLFTGDVAVVDELVDENVVSHCPGQAEPLRGRDAYRVVTGTTPFMEPRIRVEDQIAEADRVATRWTFSGRNDHELFGIPTTGRTVTVTGVLLHRFDGGRIVEEWLEMDSLGVLRQLGALPEVPAA